MTPDITILQSMEAATDADRAEMLVQVERLAEILSRTVQQVMDMTWSDLADHNTRTVMRTLAMRAVTDHADGLFDTTVNEEIERATSALYAFATREVLQVTDSNIDLAGFGEAPVYFATREVDDEGEPVQSWLLLSEVAEALAVPIHKAHRWAQHQHTCDIERQREIDEERGDGRLGWDKLDNLIDLDLYLHSPKPAEDGGEVWGSHGEWLISRTYLMRFFPCSPWFEEFMDNISPHFGMRLRRHLPEVANLQAYHPDGTPSDAELFGNPEGLTEEEALKRARRGPGVDPR